MEYHTNYCKATREAVVAVAPVGIVQSTGMNPYAPWVGISMASIDPFLSWLWRARNMDPARYYDVLVVVGRTMGGSFTMAGEAGYLADDRPPRATAEFPNGVFRIPQWGISNWMCGVPPTLWVCRVTVTSQRLTCS